MGSTSYHVAQQLCKFNGIDRDVELVSLETPSADGLIERFRENTIDALFVTGAVGSPLVQSMFAVEGVRLLSFDRAEAYAELIPGVTTVVAPEGVFNLARNVPSEDANLLTNTTCLIAHESLHPAVVPMILMAAENVGANRTMFSSSIEFPTSEDLTLPLDAAAQRYFRQGETGLTKYLPYSVARWLNHLGFLVLPLLTLAVLLLKLFPTGMRIWCGFRIKRYFKELVAVEKGHAAGDDVPKLVDTLDRIDKASATMFIPVSTVHDYIDFRQFLHDLRERVKSSDGKR